MSIDYKQKYLKYKSKYLELKQIAGESKPFQIGDKLRLEGPKDFFKKDNSEAIVNDKFGSIKIGIRLTSENNIIGNSKTIMSSNFDYEDIIKPNKYFTISIEKTKEGEKFINFIEKAKEEYETQKKERNEAIKAAREAREEAIKKKRKEIEEKKEKEECLKKEGFIWDEKQKKCTQKKR